VIGAVPPEHAIEFADVAGALVRWTLFGGTLVALGAVTFVDGILALRGVSLSAEARDAVLARVRRLVQIVATTLIACYVARLVLQVAQVADGDPMMPVARAVLSSTQWGTGLIVGLAGAAGLLASAKRFASGHATWKMLRWLSVVALAASPALTGHAVATRGFAGIPVIADIAHVLGAGAWLGTLTVIVATALRRGTSTDVADEKTYSVQIVRAFSPIALASAGVVTLSGIVGGWLHVGTIANLWHTDYGLWLTRKVVFFLFIVAAGAYNWRRATPRFAGDDRGAAPLMRSATVELALTGLLLAITAILVVTSPSIDR
jgi:putative copper export protein